MPAARGRGAAIGFVVSEVAAPFPGATGGRAPISRWVWPGPARWLSSAALPMAAVGAGPCERTCLRPSLTGVVDLRRWRPWRLSRCPGSGATWATLEGVRPGERAERAGVRPIGTGFCCPYCCGRRSCPGARGFICEGEGRFSPPSGGVYRLLDRDASDRTSAVPGDGASPATRRRASGHPGTARSRAPTSRRPRSGRRERAAFRGAAARAAEPWAQGLGVCSRWGRAAPGPARPGRRRARSDRGRRSASMRTTASWPPTACCPRAISLERAEADMEALPLEPRPLRPRPGDGRPSSRPRASSDRSWSCDE